jgi:hypothetical protein
MLKHRLMPQSLSLVISFSLTSLIFSNSANAFTARKTWKWTAPPLGVSWNDFHVQIKTDTEILGIPIIDSNPTLGGIINLPARCPGPVINPPPPPPDFPNGMDTLYFANCNTAGLAGQMLVLNVEYNLKRKNRLKPVDPYYTNNGIRIDLGHSLGGNPVFVGFDVSERNSPSVELTLFNSSTEEALNISNLSWSYKPQRTPQDELIPFTLPNFISIPGSFEIPINSNISFTLNNLPEDPGYILFQGTSVGQISGFSSDFIGEHEEPIPEPTSTFSFLALGTLGAASTLKRKLKSFKSSEKETTKVG